MTGDDPKDLEALAASATVGEVTLVIPGRNCAATLDRCLQSVVPLKQSGELKEIIFVDDGSTDTTPEIAACYPVRVITGAGQGPGAARNLGWQAAESELIWFIDSDCVAHPDALQKLLPHMSEPDVAGVGGSYSNLFPESLLASLIHEEIVSRHRRMDTNVNFLATFNVVYRRQVLEQVCGFDESLKLAQDAELAYRIIASDHRLRFELDARVGHHHPRSWGRYLRTQRRQGFYRMKLYRSHPAMISGDSYAGLVDYAQPPLACLTWATAVAAIFWLPMLVPAVISAVLMLLLQWPMTRHSIQALGIRGTVFAMLGFVRAHSRAAGMVAGTIANLRSPTVGEFASAKPRQAATSTCLTCESPEDFPDVSSVSVIIPSRNRVQKLVKCLDSLQNQTVAGFEVVVVNDGSSDDTPQQLQAYAGKSLAYSLLVIDHQQPRGANPSRNAALERSQGQWIAMLDDDCFPERDWLQRMMCVRERYDAIAVAGHVENIALSNQWERFFIGQQRVTSTIRNGKPIARRLVACNALVHRDWLCGNLDEDRAKVSNDMAISGRGDEEGLRIAIQRVGKSIIHAKGAKVYHDHPYKFRSFCKQAFKSGRSTARLARKYSLSPRWELVMTAVACLTLPFVWFSSVAAVACAISFALSALAFTFNELALKRKTIGEAFETLPALVLYAILRASGYVAERLRPISGTNSTGNEFAETSRRSSERQQTIEP